MLSEGHGEVFYESAYHIYDNKEKEEFVEWTEKNMDNEISRYLQVHLQSRNIKPLDIKHVWVVAGGDHGDTAFQFGASVSVELCDGNLLEFEVSIAELICRKDTGALIQKTILPRLTAGLKVVATKPLHVYHDDNGELLCGFNPPSVQTSSKEFKIDVYITGDLAFQAIALGKEGMAPHWCTLCKAHKKKFLDSDCNCNLWTMVELCRLGNEAEASSGKPKLGVKKCPWWPFIPVCNYIVPLLHCEIGVGNQLLWKLRDMINDNLEKFADGEEA